MVDVNSIKARLRINHDKLDDQFAQDIEAAKAELVRVGLLKEAVDAVNDPLIDKAIIAYCLWIEADSEKTSYGYKAQWNQWKDELRKSPNYGYEVENV